VAHRDRRTVSSRRFAFCRATLKIMLFRRAAVSSTGVVRYLEKMARMDECRGATVNKLADSFIVYSGASTQFMSGLSHLEGEQVCVWGNGRDLGNYTVSGGAIELSEVVTYAVIGLSYVATFQTAKLPYAAQMGSALAQKKKIDHIGLILTDTHYQGLEFGQNFDRMDNLPKVIEGATVPADTIWSEFDAPMISLPGNWQSDARLCLRATAPRPGLRQRRRHRHLDQRESMTPLTFSPRPART
jgi:hypothetical protein